MYCAKLFVKFGEQNLHSVASISYFELAFGDGKFDFNFPIQPTLTMKDIPWRKKIQCLTF